MLTILLHSSKTMRAPSNHTEPYQAPRLVSEARELADYLRGLTPVQLQKYMQLSKVKALQTHELLASWTDSKSQQRPAIDAFLGDIYSGLQVQTFNPADRAYANRHLLILSGLYGGLRALDSVYPYRLEMGYRLPQKTYANLYTFWGDRIAKLVPAGDIVNLSAVEYTKAVLPFLPDSRVITPKFMTISPKTGEPTFVTVHAKVARGAFTSWMIRNRIEVLKDMVLFSDIGYEYDASLSIEAEPVFVCREFGGIGLSVRLS